MATTDISRKNSNRNSRNNNRCSIMSRSNNRQQQQSQQLRTRYHNYDWVCFLGKIAVVTVLVITSSSSSSRSSTVVTTTTAFTTTTTTTTTSTKKPFSSSSTISSIWKQQKPIPPPATRPYQQQKQQQSRLRSISRTGGQGIINGDAAVSATTTTTTTTSSTTRLVWLTGCSDLRLNDHGGFLGAFNEESLSNSLSGDDEKQQQELIVPVFVIDPKMHLRSKPMATIKRLHIALSSLERSINQLASTSKNISPLVVRYGASSWSIPSIANELNATSIHVIQPDVVTPNRKCMMDALHALNEMEHISIHLWDNALRNSGKAHQLWGKDKTNIPEFFQDYCLIADVNDVAKPKGTFEHLLNKYSDQELKQLRILTAGGDGGEDSSDNDDTKQQQEEVIERKVIKTILLEEEENSSSNSRRLSQYLESAAAASILTINIDDDDELNQKSLQSSSSSLTSPPSTSPPSTSPPSPPLFVKPTIPTNGVPTLAKLIQMSKSVTPHRVTEARQTSPANVATNEPYEELIHEFFTTEHKSRIALSEYNRIGQDNFANKYFLYSDARNVGYASKGCHPCSMYAQAHARLFASTASASSSSSSSKNQFDISDVMGLRETATRTFSSSLSYGGLSAREVLYAARNDNPIVETPPVLSLLEKKQSPSKTNEDLMDDNNKAELFPSDDPLWGRSTGGALSDVVEWREWFHLLAERSLAVEEQQEKDNGILSSSRNSGGSTSSDGDGDPREKGKLNYWRFKNQHLVRYLTFPPGRDYESTDPTERPPALLLIHGFAASAEQWERFVYSLRQQYTTKSMGGGKDLMPPIYAMDLLGFGHAEKPGLSYTQYVWEAQVVDFVLEVMEATPMVLVGNSIGGGISAGAAKSLQSSSSIIGGSNGDDTTKDICKGVVLCNTAGVLKDPKEYNGYTIEQQQPQKDGSVTKDEKIPTTYTEAAMMGNPYEKPYSPIPILGNKSLDLFGYGIIQFLYPQIADRLTLIYGNNMRNADTSVINAIKQGASSPGSANVIGCGHKLSPNRPLNEVLDGMDALVFIGLDDQVSSPAAAKIRAERFRDYANTDSGKKMIVTAVEGSGHCPHDETPDLVASAVYEWFQNSNIVEEKKPTKKTTTMITKEEDDVSSSQQQKQKTMPLTSVVNGINGTKEPNGVVVNGNNGSTTTTTTTSSVKDKEAEFISSS